MSKKRRNVVGSVLKAKDGGPDYIKMRDGKIYRLESQKQQLASLEDAVAKGKLSPEIAEKAKERIDKIPPFVRFEIVELVDVDK